MNYVYIKNMIRRFFSVKFLLLATFCMLTCFSAQSYAAAPEQKIEKSELIDETSNLEKSAAEEQQFLYQLYQNTFLISGFVVAATGVSYAIVRALLIADLNETEREAWWLSEWIAPGVVLFGGLLALQAFFFNPFEEEGYSEFDDG